MNIRALATTLVLILLGTTAQAVSLPTTLALAPPQGTVVQDNTFSAAQNSTFTVNLNMDATAAPGEHPALVSGKVQIDFNKNLLTYNSFVLGSGLALGSPVTISTSGDTQTIFLWFLNAPDLSKIGTFSFTAIGAPGSLATLGLADAETYFGSSFINKAGHDVPIPVVTFTGIKVNITAVPLPASVWLLGTAVGALAARRRLRRRTGRTTGRTTG